MTRPIFTYLLATKNKLSTLKEVLSSLLPYIAAHDELIIIDGASTDDTPRYLQDLSRKTKNLKFKSEADFGEAHALNKGLLLARGEVIKFISDDDVFDWEGIIEGKKYLLDHKEVDALGSRGFGTDWSRKDPFVPLGQIKNPDFLEWRRKRIPFSFCGLGLFIKRDVLASVGNFNTHFMRVDMEYTLRLTSSKVRLAWYTRNLFVRITNPKSQSVIQEERAAKEGQLLDLVYLGKESVLGKETRSFVWGNLFRPVPAEKPRRWYDSPGDVLSFCADYLWRANQEYKGEFLI